MSRAMLSIAKGQTVCFFHEGIMIYNIGGNDVCMHHPFPEQLKPKTNEQLILEQAIKDCDNTIEHKQLMKQKYEQQLKELENE